MNPPLVSVLSLASASALALMLGLAATSAQAVPVLAVDLTVNNSGTITDGANTVTFLFDKLQPTGSGVLGPFLRMTSHGNATNEQGYNTSASAGTLPFDEIAGVHTHDVFFSSLQTVGGLYNFVLDIGEPVATNQNQGQLSLLSLDGLKLYVSATPGQNSSSVDANGNASGILGTLLWDMDAGGVDNYILLDANRNGQPGNGVSDMLMQVPTSVFASVNPANTPYFILWSRFGLQEGARAGSAAQGTFEEWAQLKTSNGGGPPQQEAPEPGVLLLMGAGLMGLGLARRRKPV